MYENYSILFTNISFNNKNKFFDNIPECSNDKTLKYIATEYSTRRRIIITILDTLFPGLKSNQSLDESSVHLNEYIDEMLPTIIDVPQPASNNKRKAYDVDDMDGEERPLKVMKTNWEFQK